LTSKKENIKIEKRFGKKFKKKVEKRLKKGNKVLDRCGSK